MAVVVGMGIAVAAVVVGMGTAVVVVADVVEIEVLVGRDVIFACAQADLREVVCLWCR